MTAIDDTPIDDTDPRNTTRALHGRVTIGATSVLVDLSNEWRAGGEVVVVLRNVQTAVPRSLTERPVRPVGVTVGGAPYHELSGHGQV